MRLTLLLMVLAAGCSSNHVDLPRLWQERAVTVVETPRANNYVSAFDLADGADVMAVGMVDDSIRLYRASDFTLLATRAGREANGVDQPGVSTLAVNARGDRVVAQHYDTGIWIYDGNLQPVVQLSKPGLPFCTGLLWLRDGSGVIGYCHNHLAGWVVRWDPVTGRITHREAGEKWKTGSDTFADLIELEIGHVVVAAGWEVREFSPELKELSRFRRPDQPKWNPVQGVVATGRDSYVVITDDDHVRELWSFPPYFADKPMGWPIDRGGTVSFSPFAAGRQYAILEALEPDLRPIKIYLDGLTVGSVIWTGEPANASRNLLAIRWESPTTLAIYSHLTFERKPGRLQRHRVHIDFGDLQMPRPADQNESEPAAAVDSIFPESTAPATTQPGGGLFDH